MLLFSDLYKLEIFNPCFSCQEMKLERLATVYDEMVEDEDIARVDPFESRALSKDDTALKKALELATGNIEMEREYQYNTNISQDQRTAIVNPADGLLVFDTDSSQFFCHLDSLWIPLTAGNIPMMEDKDTDTRIYVEKVTDEDKIRFENQHQ